jgi:hypothetical protein
MKGMRREKHVNKIPYNSGPLLDDLKREQQLFQYQDSDFILNLSPSCELLLFASAASTASHSFSISLGIRIRIISPFRS